MGFLMSSKRLSRDLRLLILFGACRTISDLFLGTFFVSFLMHMSADEIVSVSSYRLFEYVACFAGFFLFANLVKRYNKVVVFGLSLLPKIAVLLSIILLGDCVTEYVIPLGVMYGISAAMYYLPYHAMTVDKVSGLDMGCFIGTKNSVSYFVRIVAPVVLGCFIDMASYTNMVYVLLGMSLAEIIMVFLLSPSRHRSCNPIDFVGFYRCMMRFPVIRMMFFSGILRGFGFCLLGTVITMYTVYIFHTDLKLGILTTLFALCSVITCWLLRYIRSDKTYRTALLVSVIVMLLSLSLFVYKTTSVTFLLYNFVYATAIVLIDQIDSILVYKLSQSKCVTQDTRIEYFVFRDFSLFIGRWISCVALMYVGVFGGYAWLRWFLVLVGVSLTLWGVLNIRLLHSLISKK